jgi:hypothetical protein
MVTRKPGRQLRVLDFDTECRPMHYSEWRPESQITAYAWKWIGEDGPVHLRQLHHQPTDAAMREWESMMLWDFANAYYAADIVTGHYVLRHDLPLINDHCMRLGLPLLGSKLVSDTKTLMPSVKALGLSQENLGDLLRIDEKKHHMSGRKWAQANSLTDEGLAQSATRVIDDVLQHIAIRDEAVKRAWLGPPVQWSGRP